MKAFINLLLIVSVATAVNAYVGHFFIFVFDHTTPGLQPTEFTTDMYLTMPVIGLEIRSTMARRMRLPQSGLRIERTIARSKENGHLVVRCHEEGKRDWSFRDAQGRLYKIDELKDLDAFHVIKDHDEVLMCREKNMTVIEVYRQ